jgi:hypothetical protein
VRSPDPWGNFRRQIIVIMMVTAGTWAFSCHGETTGEQYRMLCLLLSSDMENDKSINSSQGVTADGFLTSSLSSLLLVS